MAKKSEIKELSEILATALADRPDLSNRLSTMLGARPQAGTPGKAQPELTLQERKSNIRFMFRKQFLSDQLKKSRS